MLKLINNKEAIANLNKYMFTPATMKKLAHGPVAVSVSAPHALLHVSASHGPAVSATHAHGPASLAHGPASLALLPVPRPASLSLLPVPRPASHALLPVPVVSASLGPASLGARTAKPFVPFQKDKLFWCFYIILNGYEEYEMNHSNSFSLEKQIKIETVEQLKSIKEKLKDLKLKRTEIEDDLVNKPMITLKGLYALCLVHNVSITYIYGRKYCEINAEAGASEAAPQLKKGIIMQNAKKEDSLKWTSNEINSNTDFLTQIQQDYWLIDNIQKPLKASSAYTLQELQTICEKLQIPTHTTLNEKTKAKTKTKLYEEITQSL
jgi:hypothetical protein